MTDLEKRIVAIERRNEKVEQDKAWETSWTRRISITLLTYLVVVTYLLTINNERPFINGLIPAMGYFLSTLVLKTVRNVFNR